jgi:hypothetical protein
LAWEIDTNQERIVTKEEPQPIGTCPYGRGKRKEVREACVAVGGLSEFRALRA